MKYQSQMYFDEAVNERRGFQSFPSLDELEAHDAEVLADSNEDDKAKVLDDWADRILDAAENGKAADLGVRIIAKSTEAAEICQLIEDLASAESLEELNDFADLYAEMNNHLLDIDGLKKIIAEKFADKPRHQRRAC